MNSETQTKKDSDEKPSPFWQDILKLIWKDPRNKHEPDIVVREEF